MRPEFKLPKYLIVSLIFYTLAACNSSPYVTVKTDYDHAAASERAWMGIEGSKWLNSNPIDRPQSSRLAAS